MALKRVYNTWSIGVVVKIVVPFCVLSIIRHLIFRGPKTGASTLLGPSSKRSRITGKSVATGACAHEFNMALEGLPMQ